MHGTDPGSLRTTSPEQVRVPFALMRGGTSKAVFVRGTALPRVRTERDITILALFGSPDRRQIDGLGGADLLTSKLAIIDPPSRPDADLDYTFAQVSITEPVVDYDINCGNISAAVAAYAVDEQLVEVTEPFTEVRIHNTNTGRILRAEVPVVAGRAAVEGNYEVHGVPGTGAPIALDFGQTAGGITGSLLPTGNVTDVLDTPLGSVTVTILDLANLTVFVDAQAVGMTGTEGPSQCTAEHLSSVATVKAAAARLLGMPTNGLTPVPAIVSGPADYRSFASGDDVAGSEVDLVARVVGGRPAALHKAYPGTLAACTGVAARPPGTVVHRVMRADRPDNADGRIGHTSGVMPVRARISQSADGWVVDEAIYHRTARRLAEGTAFLRRSVLLRQGDS